MSDLKILLEWFGYAASVVVAASLMMSSIVLLRWLNLAGALMFSTYGFLINALPVGFLNLFIVLVDIYYIVQMSRTKEYFHLLHVENDLTFISHLLAKYSSDIKKYFPAFNLNKDEAIMSFLILRNSTIAGILIGRRRGDALEVLLDFAAPEYRDLKTGGYIFKDNGEFFKKLGISRFIANTDDKQHCKYLEKMGFKNQQDGEYTLVLK